ncbi:adenylyl-sulfate kinase [bacterium]|nr:adenylyl-sulfate kinase [bacterium]
MTDAENRGFTLWFTGIPGSGKTTLAEMAMNEIHDRGVKAELLDGDVIELNLNKGLGYSKDDIITGIKRVGFVCHLLSRNGVVAIASATSPYREARDENRRMIGSFVEVFVKCPPETCAKRCSKDVNKGPHDTGKKGCDGGTGPYEEPLNPDVIVETDRETREDGLARIIKKLEAMGYIPKKEKKTRGALQKEEIYSVEEEEKIKERLKELGYI